MIGQSAASNNSDAAEIYRCCPLKWVAPRRPALLVIDAGERPREEEAPAFPD